MAAGQSNRIEIHYDMGGMSFHHPDVVLPGSGYIERQPDWPDSIPGPDGMPIGNDPDDGSVYSPAEKRFISDFARNLADQTGAITIWDAETKEEQSIDEFVASE